MGTTAALLVLAAVNRLTGHALLAAYLAAVAEALFYYGIHFWRELASVRAVRAGPLAADVALVVRSMVLEFGGAEVLDVPVVRPLCLAAAYELAGTAGALAGKVAADIIFYVTVVAVRELRGTHASAYPGPVLRGARNAASRARRCDEGPAGQASGRRG